jgi:hypothetical protein
VEKADNQKVFEFLTRLHGTKPVEYDYAWTAETGVDFHGAYEKKLVDFKKGKLDNNLPLVKLNRHISEVYAEVADGNFSSLPGEFFIYYFIIIIICHLPCTVI